jgi:serine/threonine-protein kinase
MSRFVKNYEIVRPLGEGGMGTVFYAIETQLRREVALKCLRPEIANNPGVMERFRNEAQAQAQLNHPNVAHLYEYFQLGPEHFMAMEYVNGPTLSKVLRDRGRLPYEEATSYAIQALQGLEHAHKHGIVHRDIKPANLMLNKEGQVKVTDFGIARVSGTSRKTRAGMIVGTYEYISPEAAQGLPTTALSDLYSIGVVLFELITGRLPFDSKNEYELLKMHVQASRPSIRAFVKEAPGSLDDAVQRGMERSIRRRFRSAEEMAGELQKCLELSRRTAPAGRSWLGSLFGGDPPRDKSPQPERVTAIRRRTDISSTCHRIEDLLEQHLWAEASAALEAGLRAYPSEPDLIDLSNRLQRQRQQYEQGIGQQAELVRNLLDRGLPEAAISAVGNALSTYPGAASLLALQAECRQRVDLANASAGELAQVQKRVDELIGSGKFQEATDYVLELHGGNYNQNELNKLLARILQERKEAEKQEAIQRDLSESGRAADAGQWDKALAILERALRRFPREARLKGFQKTVTERWHAELRRQAVVKLIAEVRELEKSDSLQAAKDRLAEDLDSLGRDPSLLVELQRIEAALEAVRREGAMQGAIAAAAGLQAGRKWPAAIEVLDQAAAAEGADPRLAELRATICAEFRAHQVLVDRAAGEARAHIQEGQWEEALLRLSTAMRELPGERVLSDLLQEAQHGLAQKRRAETIARIKSEAERHSRARDYPEALRLLLDAVSQYPEDETLGVALSQTVFERDTYLARKKAEAVLQRASELREAGEFDAAIRLLRDATKDVPQNADLRQALSGLEAEWREIRRRRVVDEVAAAVQKGIASEDYPPAFDSVAGGLAAWPEEPELLALGHRVRTARRQTQVRLTLAAALESAGLLEDQQRWEESAKVCEQTLADFPETEAELEPRIALTHQRALEARRKARIANLERNISESIEAGLLEEAATVLAGAEREFAGEPGFATWREKLDQERQRVAREAAIRTAVEKSRRCLENRCFEDAESVLQGVQTEWGPQAALTDALDLARRTQREHIAAIESALAGIRTSCEERNWDLAISAALSQSERFPDDPRFKALLTEACQKRELEKRRGEIDRRIAQIQALLGEQAFDDVEILIRAALRDFPGDPAFPKLSEELEQAREAALAALEDQADAEAGSSPAGQEQAVKAISEALDLASTAKEFDDAIALLEYASVEFPEIEAFSRMLHEARSRLAAEQTARRLGDAERTVRLLLAEQKHETALAEVESALAEYPNESVLLGLRASIAAGIEEKASVAAIIVEVERLAAAGQGTQADRLVLDGLRRYPNRVELTKLRQIADAARAAEWDKKSREAGLRRSVAEIGELLAKARTAEAAAALEKLERQYGQGAAPEIAQKVASARLADAERQAKP